MALSQTCNATELLERLGGWQHRPGNHRLGLGVRRNGEGRDGKEVWVLCGIVVVLSLRMGRRWAPSDNGVGFTAVMQGGIFYFLLMKEQGEVKGALSAAASHDH